MLERCISPGRFAICGNSMLIIMVLKVIKVAGGGGSVLPLHDPRVLPLLRWLLLCKRGRRYVPSVYK